MSVHDNFLALPQLAFTAIVSVNIYSSTMSCHIPCTVFEDQNWVGEHEIQIQDTL